MVVAIKCAMLPNTLVATNISPFKGTVEDVVPFPNWWAMFISWRVMYLRENPFKKNSLVHRVSGPKQVQRLEKRRLFGHKRSSVMTPRDPQGHGTPENGKRDPYKLPISLGIRKWEWD